MIRWIALALLIALLSPLCFGAALAEEEITSVAQLNEPGRVVGVDMGSAAETTARQLLPNANIVVYNDKTAAFLAVAQGKLDAFVYDWNQLNLAMESGVTGVHLLEETIGEPVSVAVGVSPATKIPGLMDSVNAFIAELRADGTLDDMYRRWVLLGDETMPDIPAPDQPTMKLIVGTSGIVPPYSYYIGTDLAGYDIEMARRFAAWLGAELEFKVYDYGAIINAAASGDVDCVMANLNITPERAEKMPYSDVLYEDRIGVMVRGDAETAAGAYTAFDQLNGRRIAAQTGSVFDRIVLKALPEAQIVYINSAADMIAALQSGKIAAFAMDEPAARQICAENGNVVMMDGYLESAEFGFALPKTDAGEALLAELDPWLTAMKESGALEAVLDKWTNGPEEEKTLPDYRAFPGPKGTLTLATEGDYMPLNYFRGNEIVGAEIDLAAQFCEANGYALKVDTMNFEGVLPAVQTGKADFAAAGISITDERRETTRFSVPYYTGGTVLCVLRGRENVAGGITSVAQLNAPDIRLGLPQVSAADGAVRDELPEAQVVRYNDNLLGFMDVANGRLDAYVYDEVQMKIALENGVDGVRMLDDFLDQKLEMCVGISPVSDIPDLEDKVNRFIAEMRDGGVIEDMCRRWIWDAERTMPDIELAEDPACHLVVATSGIVMPFSYYADNTLTGFDIEMAYRFAQWLGADVEFAVYDYGSIVPAATSGKADVIMANLQYTEERAQSGLIFSDVVYTGRLAVLVRDGEAAQADAIDAEDASFLNGIASSFNKTFVREGRWKLFVEGVVTTLLITLLAIVCGTLLGFAVFMLCRKGNPVANLVTRFCLWLVQGMPMVVLLMILYYIIFGSVAISGVIVAVIGFTLTFGAAVFGLLRMGVGAVDSGQYEAAWALGYSDRRTFFRIILPQALPHVLPAYKGEIVGLIKATAIVGYIAVQDLTKMGDIVRSRTYEAFFPLIAVTIIYFVLEGLIGFLVSRITVGFNPKRRKPADILKGVKSDD